MHQQPPPVLLPRVELLDEAHVLRVQVQVHRLLEVHALALHAHLDALVVGDVVLVLLGGLLLLGALDDVLADARLISRKSILS